MEISNLRTFIYDKVKRKVKKIGLFLWDLSPLPCAPFPLISGCLAFLGRLKCVNKYHMVCLIKGHLCVPDGLYMTI